MYVYIQIHTCLLIHFDMHVDVYTFMRTPMSIYLFDCVCAYLSVGLQKTSMCVRARKYMKRTKCMRSCTYIYIYTYTHVLRYMYNVCTTCSYIYTPTHKHHNTSTNIHTYACTNIHIVYPKIHLHITTTRHRCTFIMAVSTILSPSIVSNRPLPYRTEPQHLGPHQTHLPHPYLPPLPS